MPVNFTKYVQSPFQVNCKHLLWVAQLAYVNSLRPSDAYIRRQHTFIGSDNGLSPVRHQTIIWTNAGTLWTVTIAKSPAVYGTFPPWKQCHDISMENFLSNEPQQMVIAMVDIYVVSYTGTK